MRSRSSARAPGSANNVTGSPVSLITAKIVRLKMNSVTTAYIVRRNMNWAIATLLPMRSLFRRRDPRPDRVEEGMPKYRHEVIFLKDPLLDFLGEFLALRGVERGDVLRE